LLSLGDLARYKESVSEGKEKDYDVAYRYYERAAFLVPTSGNPQNQLAVLATYGQSELVAVYHYCRSVLVAHPFSLGYTNLSTLFGKNERSYAQALRHGLENNEPGAPAGSGLRRQSSGSKNDNKIKVNLFLLQFIRLNARIFYWAANKFQLLDTSKTAGTADINVDEFAVEVHDMFNDFEVILTYLSDALLVRLIIICIYSVHESIPAPSRSEDQEKIVVRNRGPRTKGESLALIIIYSFISR
jgi:hypothetical protein